MTVNNALAEIMTFIHIIIFIVMLCVGINGILKAICYILMSC